MHTHQYLGSPSNVSAHQWMVGTVTSRPRADTQTRLLTFVLIDGGLAGFVWGYVAIVIGFLFVYASLGEMASMSVNCRHQVSRIA